MGYLPVPENGSSPRMWGTPLTKEYISVRGRFIPTYVGNTSILIGNKTPFSVHPHVCGEHIKMSVNGLCFSGSSPRMWGTR